jgi:DNA repair protein RecN (Recombination protein N)
VKKVKKQGHTTTDIVTLSSKQRIGEIGRMLGGLEMTDQTLAHAEEMITLAQKGQ